MPAGFQTLVVLGAWLMTRPTLASAAQGVHVDYVSSQLYFDHTKPDQTSVSLRGKGKFGYFKAAAMRSLAVGAGFTALCEAPMIWDKLSSMLGCGTSSPLELSNVLEGDAALDGRHHLEKPWRIRVCFAVICFCTFVLGMMRRSFQRSAKPTTPAMTFDTRVQTPRVERCTTGKKTVMVVSPMVTPRGKANRTWNLEGSRWVSSGHEGVDEKTDDSCSDEEPNRPMEIQFHKIYTPGTSRATSRASSKEPTADDEFEAQFHKSQTPGTSGVSSKDSARAAAQPSSYGWEAE